MQKYIDSEKLIAEIERLNSLVSYESKDRHDEGLHDAYKAVKNVIDSLQQEQSEVDLEKEIDSEWIKCNPIDEGMGSEYANVSIEQFDALARHFYELGQREMRHRITNPEYNAKVIEQLKSEYPTIKED